MMHITERAARHKSTVVSTCVALSLLPLYYGSWRFHLASKPAQLEPIHHTPIWSHQFIDDWLETQIIEPFDPAALRRYCDLMTWRPNLVLNLADANGGIGNIRGNFLDFFMYAIEAGASIMLPGRATRNEDDLHDVWAGRAAFDTFFDEQWFLYTMQEACPKLSIYNFEVHHLDTIDGIYTPRSRRVYAEAELDKKAYLKDLDQWLSTRSEYTQDNKTVVNYSRTLWEYDTRGMPPGVRRTMGQLLRINPTIRRLAAAVVQQLAERFEIHINPRDAMPQDAFFGAHLRTESDALAAGWLNAPNTNFSAQTDAYIEQAVAHKLNVMFVASGNASDLQRFKEKAAAYNPPLSVTSKLDLLSSAQLDELQALTWDQQALVDYEVLQRCSVFGGFVRSSFSYNIALTRNQWLDDHGLLVDPWTVLHSEEAVAFDDGYSRVIGRDELHESKIPRGMWP
ncbi:hypothetical protein AMS68_000788 [Peltaster fructicola]|uniref:Alternative oxidase n=1 Tax=Peltaster fructicola TaxID=286661 RepID=A0A6H0XKW1_9PEZI|nr:hypothetical protein AMS68_000788 [Peltaster fructicola]